MTDLRKAAEMALEALEDIFGKEKKDVGAINALRQALAHEALDRMVAENQRLGLYDDAVNISQERVDECEWVLLTNEEIDDLWKTEYFNLHYEIARAIEAKLKEKNSV